MADNIDGLGRSLDDRVSQKHTLAVSTKAATLVRRGHDDCYYLNIQTVSAVTDINVLVIVGRRGASVNRELAEVASDSSPDGIALNIFDSLADLPPYSESFESRRIPGSVAALRGAAAQADAMVIVTTYHGRMPAVVHNAIDWLTRRWDEAALHDKPLAVIGRASRCYSGVWSHQGAAADRLAAHRVIESITVSNLREAIKMLAGDVHEDGAERPALSPGLTNR